VGKVPELRVVTTNNVEVFRHLGSGPFQRLDLQHVIAASFDDAYAKIAAHAPRIAIIDVELAGGSGIELCRKLKANQALKTTHVMMVLSSVISRQTLDALQSSGCDDVLAVPIHSDDFYHHIAQIAGLPLRSDRRIDVTLTIQLPGRDSVIEGVVENISSSGAGIMVDGELARDQRVTARLVHEGTTYPDMGARVAWTGRREAGHLRAGIAFDDLPIKTRLLLERLCLFDLTTSADGGVTVSLYGDFTEVTDFSTLAQQLTDVRAIDFYMRPVRYISSAGVRSWCNFLDTLAGKRYSFRHCSMAFASQAAMVPMAIGRGEVLSVEAPYYCDTCDRDDLRLLETKTLLFEDGHIEPPTLSCTACGGELEFDDVAERYFAFLTKRDSRA
jgi:CheY-like chemotaxis protein